MTEKNRECGVLKKSVISTAHSLKEATKKTYAIYSYLLSIYLVILYLSIVRYSKKLYYYTNTIIQTLSFFNGGFFQ